MSEPCGQRRKRNRNRGIGHPVQGTAYPGHTLGHIAYLTLDNHENAGSLFCGDTLFGCGCGRLFEGTAAQMHHSLQRLAHLPDNTRVYCAHEYTEANILFGLACEPGSAALRQRQRESRELRAAGKPTLPSSIALEKATNPFLRCTGSDIIDTLVQRGLTSPYRARRIYRPARMEESLLDCG